MVHELLYFTWRDYTEIGFFTLVIYLFLRWLSQDHQKNLVRPFYVYCALAFITHYAHLSSISQLLFMSAPLMVMIFILIHQQTLQRNFITLYNVKPQAPIQTDWITDLMRGSLHAINKNCELIWIIERTQHLGEMLHTIDKINAPINLPLLTLILEKYEYNNSYIYIQHNGTLITLNAQLNLPQRAAEWINHDTKSIEPWKQDALLLTNKTDALFIHAHPHKRIFTIIFEGKILEELNGQQATALLKHHIKNNITYKGAAHAHSSIQDSSEQSLS